ncbi:MAG: RNA polymerase sigma factor [Pirellulales bacterium]
MALSDLDRNLLERCLGGQPRSWEDFVDRFMGLVAYTVNHSAQIRSIRLSSEDREDLCAEVFLAIVKDNFAVLRRFRAQSSLATYLAVIARRVTVRALLNRKTAAPLSAVEQDSAMGRSDGHGPHADFEQRVTDRQEVERLMGELDEDEAEIVRLYHLEGKTYQQISHDLDIPENSVGPMLSRAREKMRKAEDPAAS